MSSFIAAVAETIKVAEACGVRYMLTGGIAVHAWGTPRVTFDADVEAHFRDADQLACFERRFFLEEEGVDILGQKTRIYHVPINPTLIEVFVASHPYVLRALERRRLVAVPGLLEDPAWVIAPEDLLVMKALHAGHPDRWRPKAAQDVLDIESIVRTNRGLLDVELLHREAAAMGVWDALSRSL